MGRPTRARNWCFTINSFCPNTVLHLRSIGRAAAADDSSPATFLIFGREWAPTTRRRHLQGYVRFRKKQRFNTVKEFFGEDCAGIHLEGSRGSQAQNIKYCSKEKDFEQWGHVTEQGKRTDLLIIKDKIDGGATSKEISDQHFAKWTQYHRSFEAYRDLHNEPSFRSNLEVYLLVGDPGTGKTRFVYEYSQGDVWINSDPTLKWFDGYNQQGTVLLDDFRGGAELALLLRILDIYPTQVQIKGGWKPWNPTRIFLTSNVEPEFWYPSDDIAPLRRRIKKIVRFSGTFDEGTWKDRFESIKNKLSL